MKTLRQLHELTGIDIRTINYWIAEKKLNPVKIKGKGPARFINLTEWNSLMAEQVEKYQKTVNKNLRKYKNAIIKE